MHRIEAQGHWAAWFQAELAMPVAETTKLCEEQDKGNGAYMSCLPVSGPGETGLEWRSYVHQGSETASRSSRCWHTP
jgi:hypothetical protein